MGEKILGPDNPQLIRELTAEAQALRKLGRNDEAAKLEQRGQLIMAAQSNPNCAFSCRRRRVRRAEKLTDFECIVRKWLRLCSGDFTRPLFFFLCGGHFPRRAFWSARACSRFSCNFIFRVAIPCPSPWFALCSRNHDVLKSFLSFTKGESYVPF
jgi:hypothetical protein